MNPVDFLKALIATPSVSGSEEATAALIASTLESEGVKINRLFNNIWAVQPCYDSAKPTLLLNSHHDTVKPSPAYTRDPFIPEVSTDGRLYGLGSNDAGASLVCLAATFCRFYNTVLPFNLVLALTAMEENMGPEGNRAMLPHLYSLGIMPDMGLVGEPTSMQPAVGERGLVVLDGKAIGVSGHAARGEGVNALYLAIEDIERLRNYKFDKQSELLGPISLTVTQIEAGTQHNVVPAECRFVVDVRTTDAYTNEQTVEILQSVCRSELKPRSTRIQASAIDSSHPMVRAAVSAGGAPYVSPTTSDMALMHDFPTLKMGPGMSERSHTADEFVMLSEIEEGIEGYRKFIDELSVIYSRQN